MVVCCEVNALCYNFALLDVLGQTMMIVMLHFFFYTHHLTHYFLDESKKMYDNEKSNPCIRKQVK